MLFRRIGTGMSGTFLYDEENDRYVFDENAKRLLGPLAHDKASYRDMLARMPPATRGPYEQWRLEALRSGAAGRARVPFRLADRDIVLEIQFQRADGHALGILTDVSEDEKAYRDVANQLMLLAFSERVAAFGIWAYDIRGDRFSTSKGAVDLLLPGSDPSQFTFERALDRVHVKDRPALLRSYQDALERGQVRDAEFRLAEEPGRWFNAQFMRILDHDGEPMQIWGIVQETTSEHEVEGLAAERDLLQETQRMRARFVNAAAHELNQPMTPVRLQLAMLRRRLAGHDDLLPALSILERNLERVGMLLGDLLDAARSQAGSLRVQVEDVDLHDEVRQAVATLAPVAAQRRVELVVAPGDEALVRADAMRVQQCISNLLHNAIKFTAEATRVVVRVETGEREVRLSVEDQGPGLDPTQAQRVFEPFEQVHPSPKGFPGTGLGLYVTRGLMRAMGGDVQVDSAPGRGAAFRLVFPRQRHA